VLSGDFYTFNSKLKWIVLSLSILISIGSLYYTNILIDELKQREKQQVEVYAKAIEYTANEQDLNENVDFIAHEILYQNNSIPIIQTDSADNVIAHRNLDIKEFWSDKQKRDFLNREIAIMKETYEPIVITLRDANTGELFGHQHIYYKDSFLLTQLIAYPYIQLSVIAIFGFISYMAFSYSKAAEQNRVWVGLAKETAHQLGTPLSSLMAWVEVIQGSRGSR
jgi:hypothetical protein